MESKTPLTGTPREKLRGLRILTAALTAGVVIFLLIIAGINRFNIAPLATETKEYHSVILLAMTGLALVAVLLGKYIYQQRLKAIREGNDTLDRKIDKFREAVILYLAICEGMAFFSIIAFMLSGEVRLLLVTAGMLLLMLARYIALKKPEAELNLSWSEQEELNK